MEHKDNRQPSNAKSNISIGDEYYFILKSNVQIC